MKGPFSTPICTRKQKNGPSSTDQALSIASCNSHHALSIECSVMSGCGQGHEPAKNFRRKLWIKFLRLTPGRSGNTSGLHKTIREIDLVYKGLRYIGQP